MAKKILYIGGLILILILIIAGCAQVSESRESIPNGASIVHIDCLHKVVCYDRGLHAAAFSCTSVDYIPESTR